MFKKLRMLFPANRVAALAAVLTGVATLVTTFVTDGALVGTPVGDAIVKGAGIIGGAAVVLVTVNKFLDGSQKYDALLADVGIDMDDAVHQATEGDPAETVAPGVGLDVPEPAADDKE